MMNCLEMLAHEMCLQEVELGRQQEHKFRCSNDEGCQKNIYHPPEKRPQTF